MTQNKVPGIRSALTTMSLKGGKIDVTAHILEANRFFAELIGGNPKPKPELTCEPVPNQNAFLEVLLNVAMEIRV